MWPWRKRRRSFRQEPPKRSDIEKVVKDTRSVEVRVKDFILNELKNNLCENYAVWELRRLLEGKNIFVSDEEVESAIIRIMDERHPVKDLGCGIFQYYP